MTRHLPLIALVAALTFTAGTTIAQTTSVAQESEGRDLAEQSFDIVDRQAKGYVHMGDMEAFRADISLSMDANEDGDIDWPEFRAWDYGFELLAQETNRIEAYETALKVIFSLWDRNSDGKISTAEHRRAISADFQRADLDGDAVLSKSEFLSGVSVMVALRAALKPE